MKIKGNIKFVEFLQIVDICSVTQEQFDVILDCIGKKRFNTLGTHKVPENLNYLSLGQLADLQNLKIIEDLMFKPAEIILGVPREELLECATNEVLSFSLFVKKEIDRIVKLFEKVRYKPSSEEVQAGINQINHGFFGTADWYARRMGITDQQIVFDTVSWMKVYKCIAIDNDAAKFEKRYRSILNRKK